MLGVTYAMLLVGGALGYYSSGGFDQNRIQRYEPQARGVEIVEVECPVCGGMAGWISSREECPVAKDGKRYKHCRHGIYRNERCGMQLDCYRGPGERCTEKLTNDPLDQRCAPASYCHPIHGVCIGLNYGVDTRVMKLLNPNPFDFIEDRRRANNSTYLELLEEKLLGDSSLRRPKNVNELDYAIRERRAV